MDFSNFIGQDTVKMELMHYAPRTDIHIMLRGPSGYGKSTLAEMTASVRGMYDVVSGKGLVLSSLNPKAVTHIIEEVHTLAEPEILYDLMTTKPFIFCTTESGDIKPTLLNRCVCLTLGEYTQIDLMLIGNQAFNKLGQTVLALIADRCRQTPRVMRQICQRVKLNLEVGDKYNDYMAVKDFLHTIGIFEHGYTEHDLKYLSVLNQVGRASAKTMASMLGLPINTVLLEIEPFLLRNHDIVITSQGRMIFK